MMNMQSAVRRIFGAGLILAMAAAATPAVADTVTVANGGPVTFGGTFSFLRYRAGVPGQPGLNISVTCTATIGTTITNGTHIPLPADLIAITSATFAPGSIACTSLLLKDPSTGNPVSAANPLPITFTSATVGHLSSLELSLPALGNCVSKIGQLIPIAWSNASATSSAVLTLNGPFYIGKAVALGDAVDDYCYVSGALPMIIMSPVTGPKGQPRITSP